MNTTSMNEQKPMNEEQVSGSMTAAMNELSDAELGAVAGGRAAEVTIGITITIKG